MKLSFQKPQKKSIQMLCILGFWGFFSILGYGIWLWQSDAQLAQIHQSLTLKIQTTQALQSQLQKTEKTQKALRQQLDTLPALAALTAPEHPEDFLSQLLQTSTLTWVSLQPASTEPSLFELTATGPFASVLVWMHQMGEAPVLTTLSRWSLSLNTPTQQTHQQANPTLKLTASILFQIPPKPSPLSLTDPLTLTPWPSLDHFEESPFETPLEKERRENATGGLGDSQILFFHPQHVDPKSLEDLFKQAISQHLLSPDVHFTVDAHTHTLIIKGSPSDIPLIKQLLKESDQRTAEIQIQARIVAVDSKGLKELGVIWKSQGTHTLRPVGPGELSLTDLALHTGIEAPSSMIGLSWARLPSGFQLDVALQALQSDGNGKVISAPQIIVYDQHEAYIEQGKEVPFQTVSQEGSTEVQFKKAVLGLWVTPTLSPSGKIMLSIKVNNDSISQELGHAGTIPVIDTTQMKTEIAADNNQTLVLGGIDTSMETHFTHKVPLLGDIPGLGALFRSQRDQRQTAELLIFITPKVIQPRDAGS